MSRYFCLALGALLLAAPARADDGRLADTYEVTKAAARAILTHDECVREGLVTSGDANAEEQFRAAIEKTRSIDNAQLSEGITGDEIADTEMRALEDAKDEKMQSASSLDHAQCNAAEQAFPKIAYAYGLQ